MAVTLTPVTLPSVARSTAYAGAHFVGSGDARVVFVLGAGEAAPLQTAASPGGRAGSELPALPSGFLLAGD